MNYHNISFIDGIRVLEIENLFDMGMPDRWQESCDWIAKNLTPDSGICYYGYAKPDEGHINHDIAAQTAVEVAKSKGCHTVVVEYLS